MYGNVICRCEKVSAAEIIEAIHRHAGARTINGVKEGQEQAWVVVRADFVHQGNAYIVSGTRNTHGKSNKIRRIHGWY